MTHSTRATLWIAGLIGGAGACLVALPLLVPLPPERWALVAYAKDGAVYIAGVGDSCAHAFEGAAYPKDWRELRCERVRP
jgi:hypothetical protein